MSKKRGGKKNQNLDDFDDDKSDTVAITSKPAKTKAAKKGKGKSKNDDWSDNEEDAKLNVSDDEEMQPAAKKTAKKGEIFNFFLCTIMV